ncbi:MAG: DUF1778 domain-containing protein [Rhodoferax sp.]|nr:DUF1778 domain-containing protein [Rhodoferax sp.]
MTFYKRRAKFGVKVSTLHQLSGIQMQSKKHLSGRCPDAMKRQLSKNGGAMTAVIHSKSERIDVRASTSVKQLLQEAARVSHKNVSEFLLDAGIIAANQTLADRSRFELSDENWLAFQAALDQPVSAKPKLKKLLSQPGLLG